MKPEVTNIRKTSLNEALEKEIKYLKDLEVKSLRQAEKKNDLNSESLYRMQLRVRIKSYERLLKSLETTVIDISL